MNELNIVYFFFADDFYKWVLRSKLESFVETSPVVTITGITFPVSFLTLFYNPKRFMKFLFNSKKKIRKGIYSFTPFSFLPIGLVNKCHLFIKIHKWLLGFQINNFLKEIKASENRITWINYFLAFPVFSDLVKDSRLLVYQCEDEDTVKEDTILKDRVRMEDDLIEKADVIFSLSKNIYETREGKNKDHYLIPNGVDFNFFSKAASEDTPLNEDLRDIPHPIVGYLGNFRSWLDFELLELLADRFRAASFVFVGPIEREVRVEMNSLKRRSNVYFIERKDREALPGVLKAFDVCLIPFKYNRFNLATNPLKFWEYLATGKPILSIKIPDFEAYADIISLYRTKEEAVDKLRMLLQEKDYTLRERRMKLAKSNDLSLRSSQYYEALIRHLNIKNEQT